MAAPKTALKTKQGRYYENPRDPKQPLISVTNVLDTAIGKPALVGWAAKTVATNAVNRLPEITVLARTKGAAAAIQVLKSSPYEEKTTAANLGTRIHDIAERHQLGQGLPSEYTEAEDPMVQNYLAWLEDWQPVFEATEATVINFTDLWAGTLDGLVRFPRIPWLDGLYVLDYKTGKTGPYPEWSLQIGGAYAHAEVLLTPDGTEVPMPEVDGALALRIRPEKYAMHKLRSDQEIYDVFRQMAAAARYLHADPGLSYGPALAPAGHLAEQVPVSV